jgi:hypothetical protein
MDIEHCGLLSWFLRRSESHEQDGERLPSAGMPQTETASGDPAMAFEPSIEWMGDHSAHLPNRQRFVAGATADLSVSASKRATTPRIMHQRRIPSRSINDL